MLQSQKLNMEEGQKTGMLEYPIYWHIIKMTVI
jgi:hypothetical protein